jgi:type IX secretion system PorP/SprF family membrane protein
MKHKIIIVITLVLVASNIIAQQVGMYGHYFYKPMLYNPAFAGADDATNAMLIGRNQWTDFKGAPRLNAFTLDGKLTDKVGIGFNLVSDKKGISNRTTGSFSYSYKLQLNDEMHVLFGLSLGVIYQTLDFSKTLVENNSDPNLFTDAQRKTAFDANAGFAFVYKELELSAAVPQLLQNKINYVDYSNVRGYYALARHYMAAVKYRFFIIKEKDIAIVPQALIRIVPNAPLQYDATVNFDWKDKFWVGATYKSNYALAANFGVSVHKQLSIGYSYDFMMGSISHYAGTSHELMLNFKFNTPKKTTVEIQPEAQPSDKYKDLIVSLQTEIDGTEESIKELEERLQQLSKEQSRLGGGEQDTKNTLTNLVMQQLLKKIEDMFDKPDPTPEEIQDLRDEISTYFDSEGIDKTTQKTLKRKYEALNKAQHTSSVLVKGVVKFPKSAEEVSYADVIITVTEKENNKLVGTYVPNPKTGKYIFILTPGKKYSINAESKGHEPSVQDFSPAGSRESYEMTQEIRFN